MKRKRKSEQLDDTQTCDLLLTDANGRSIRAHKAILIDRSDYFAKLLNENNTNELHFDENHLIDLIHYLYKQEVEDQQGSGPSYLIESDRDNAILDGDVEILMQLLALSRKYSFYQLYLKLLVEINYKLRPSTVLTIYTSARKLGLRDLQNSTRITILSWLPQLQHSREFLDLSEEAIHDIFESEACDVDNDCKLDALSAWWSNNKEVDMTNLWAKLRTGANK